MKITGFDQGKQQVPSLFQIASYFEDFFPANGFKKIAPAIVQQLPFADLMMHPGKLRAVLASKKIEEPAGGQRPSKQSNRDMAKASPAGVGAKFSKTPPREVQKITFSLQASAAKSVQLAADFTNWEKSPIELKPSPNGLWTVEISLAPGKYSYRYRVDGQWQDDPQSSRRIPNPFGSENSVRIIG